MLLCSISFPLTVAAEPAAPRTTPMILSALIQEALAQSPMITSARKHWQALGKVPVQVATLSDPTLSLQHFTVGSPQPFAGYETSDFYYTGFGVSQEIPGPGKLRLRASEAERQAAAARAAYLAQQRQVVEQVRESYFNLFYLRKDAGLTARNPN